MALKDFLKGLGSMVGESLLTDIKDKVDDTLEDAKLKVEETTEQVLKKLISFFIVLLGIVFGLVGLSKYLTEAVPALADGIGYVVVGLALLLLGWFARYLSK